MSDQAELEVRAGIADDLSAVAGIERDADRRFTELGIDDFAADEPAVSTDLVDAVAAGRLVVAADDADRLVAFAWWSELDGQAHLEQVSVVVEAAGKRIGRRLIDWVATQARVSGFESMTLTTFADVAWNAPLYRNYGFASLEADELGPELAARCAHERDIGLAVLPRVAMRRTI